MTYAVYHPKSGRIDGWYSTRPNDVLAMFRQDWPKEKFRIIKWEDNVKSVVVNDLTHLEWLEWQRWTQTPPASVTLERFRVLRLYHWRKAVAYAKAIHEIANDIKNPAQFIPLTNIWENAKSRHIEFVQTINDLFPTGDTAERDDAK